MERDGWKVLAIVSLCINLLFVVISISVYTTGRELILQEDACVNLCIDKELVSYQFDDTDSICYCIDREGDITYIQDMNSQEEMISQKEINQIQSSI